MPKTASHVRSRKPAANTKPQAPEEGLKARDLLDPQHPLHRAFQAWVEARGPSVSHITKDNAGQTEVISSSELTIRKARKFLAAFPGYRKAKAA